MLLGSEVDLSGSWLCPLAGLGVGRVETSGEMSNL